MTEERQQIKEVILEYELAQWQRDAQIGAAADRFALAKLARPPRWLLHESWKEYQTAWAEALRQALEPNALSAAFQVSPAASEALRQALEPNALSVINEALGMIGEQGRMIAESFTTWAQPFDLSTARGALSDLQLARGALNDLSIVRGALSTYPAGKQNQAPAVVHQRPEPPAERRQVVHLAPGDWRDAINHAITSGQASHRDVGEFLHSLSAQQRQAGLFPPDWALIEAVVAIYKEAGHKHTYETFVMHLARKSITISVATFKRWLKCYEDFTGEEVRPGRGKKRTQAIMS